MNLATYARRNMFRRRWRTILTIVVIALTVVIFGISFVINRLGDRAS